jgi:hypothetical protein
VNSGPKYFMMVFLWAVVYPSYASESNMGAQNLQSDFVQKVGGEYRVSKIDRNGSGVFLIEFKATQPSGRFDILKLESDHVHVSVKVGQVLRLSAEVLDEQGPVAEVGQMVLFIYGQSGRVPVWLLSRKAMGRDLKAVRYLEMHFPANDFVVM